MEQKKIIYHGSQKIISQPVYGAGKPYNDYGTGFYCTESLELAKEWACPVMNDGYANKYELDLSELNIMRLTDGEYTILNWLAILLKNRSFDIDSNIGSNAKQYILREFLPDTKDVDVMIGYRADDSYFSFAEDFVNNTISVRDLSYAMQLGRLGEQIVLLSRRSFEKLSFLGYETADHREYYKKRLSRDAKARKDYKERKRSLNALMDDIFVLDMIREGMKNDDPRLRSELYR